MRKRLILTSLLMGVLATLLSARIDDALDFVGRARLSPLEIAADAESVMVRRLGISSVEIAHSQLGSAPASPSAVLKRASGAKWTTDPLAALGAANWVGPVQHQVVFWQGWPLEAFSAWSTPQGGLKDGVMLGAPRSSRVVALSPVWSGLLGNTLLFASVVWLALSSIGLFRRTLRRRANVCERCAYAKRGIPTGALCPECGHSDCSVA